MYDIQKKIWVKLYHRALTYQSGTCRRAALRKSTRLASLTTMISTSLPSAEALMLMGMGFQGLVLHVGGRPRARAVTGAGGDLAEQN